MIAGSYVTVLFIWPGREVVLNVVHGTLKILPSTISPELYLEMTILIKMPFLYWKMFFCKHCARIRILGEGRIDHLVIRAAFEDPCPWGWGVVTPSYSAP